MCPAFAFLAACAFALGTVLQQKGTLATTNGDSYWLIQILREPVWLAGLLLQASGWVLQAVALDKGPLMAFQAITTLSLVIALPFGWWLTGQQRALALLAVLCVFRLLPHGFTNADLRRHLAPMLGTPPGLMTSGQITYDLRRLRLHGLIECIPHTFRYQVTDAGMRSAQFLTRVHDRLLRTGLAEITDPSPPASTVLRAADRAYQAALDDLTRQAGIAA